MGCWFIRGVMVYGFFGGCFLASGVSRVIGVLDY